MAILWDFLNILTRFLPIVRVWKGSIVGIDMFCLKCSLFPICLPPRCIVENRVILGRKIKVVGRVFGASGHQNRPNIII